MSKQIDNGGPAFPRPYSRDPEHFQDPESYAAQEGLTLRQYYAGKALSNMALTSDGEYSTEDRRRKSPEQDAKWIAIAAVRYADALIAALKAEGAV